MGVAELTFKLVSYNIRKAKGIRGSRPDLEDIALNLGALQPDMLLCQEVFHGSGGVHQSREIAEQLELLHRYEPNAEYRRGHHGNATFSRFPISRHRNTDISTNRVERRGVLYTRVHPVPGGILHIFNTHFGLNKKQRNRQARMLGELVREIVRPDEAVILGGDFNDWSGQLDPVISAEVGLENAMLLLAMKKRRTWSTRRPLFALDRIYYHNLHLVDVRVLNSPPWDRLSDHFPVEAIFSDRNRVESQSPPRAEGPLSVRGVGGPAPSSSRLIALIPNTLSCVRIGLACLFPWLTTEGRVAAAAASGLSDWLDGIIARRFGVSSVVGGLLDAVGDKLFMGIALVALTWDGALPPWQTALVLSRDLAVALTVLCIAVTRNWKAFRSMPASLLGKATTLGQFALILALLLVRDHAAYCLVPVAALSLAAGGAYLVRGVVSPRPERAR